MCKKMWQPKNVLEALWPVQLLSCLFSLGIIYYPINHARIGLSIFYTVTMMLTYFIILIYTIFIALDSPWFDFVVGVFLLVIYVNVFIYVSNIFLVWIWRKRANKVQNSTSKIDDILEGLNAPLDNRSIYMSSLRIIIAWAIISLLINIVNLLWLYNAIDLLENFILVFVLLHTIHANEIVAIRVSVAIELMELRFKKVNQILSNILDRKKNGHHEWSDIPMIITDINNSCRHQSTSRINAIDTLRIIKNIHLELSSLCNEISRIFGIQIATGLASSFVIVTGFTFVLYIIMITSTNEYDYSGKIYRVIVLIFWLIGNYLKIFNINRICANTVSEWKKTGGIIHELEIACKDNKYRDDIRQFSLQIIQNPLSFNACGLVTLGYELVHGFVGSVTTYVIILVQMYNTPV